MMDLSKKEKLNLLLNQIGIPQELIDSEFQDAYLEKLALLKEEKVWQFHIHKSRPFTCEAIEVFNARLSDAFHHIAKVDVVINTDEKN